MSTYDPVRYYEILKSTPVLKDELLRWCDTFEDKSCLEALKSGFEWQPCPEAALYIDQDYVYCRERLLREEGIEGFLQNEDFKKKADDYEDLIIDNVDKERKSMISDFF